MKSIKLIISIILVFINTQTLLSQIEIYGVITDCENEQLPGVEISVKGKKTKTYSDFDGFYKIIVPDTNAVIKYSYSGFESQIIKVGNKKNINIIFILKEKPNEVILVAKKPVIYLYPQTKTEVSLNLIFSGELLFTYPEYRNGWNVIANPNGTLTNKSDDKEYSYLFWDGKKTYNEKEITYDCGYVVSNDSVVTFLQAKLFEFGLKPHEYNEFIVYWAPQLMKNNWNFIHFRVGSDYNIISENLVNPKPETEIRVFMDFKKLDSPFIIEPQIVKTPITRKGFTLVEWGGAELNQSIKIKTENGKYINK
jgi:hypothetical protein